MNIPAGWYADTTHPGTERYWDGDVWTDRLRTIEGVPLADAPASAQLASPSALSEPTPEPVLVALATQTDAVEGTDAAAGADAAAGTRRHRIRRRTLVKGLSLVMAIVVVGVGAFLLFGRGKSADAAVTDAVNSALASHTADLDISGSGGAAGSTFSLSGTGAIDFGQNALQMSLKISSGPEQIAEQAVYLNKTIYLNLGNEIGQVLPGKSWISLDLSQLTQGSTAKSLGSGGSLGNDPAATLQILSQNGNKATDLGPSTVNGAQVEGYAVEVDQAAIKADLAKENLPAWLHQAVKNVSNQNVTYKVYVNGAGQLARMTTATTETVSGTAVNEAVTMDFTNYGATVSVTAPPAGEVGTFQSFFQAAQSLSGSSTD
jgi:hypothetical protein